jgi:hypothetical protein
MNKAESLHREHLVWLQHLDFYQDEIRFSQNRLLQVVLKHFREVNMETVAQFREKFLQMLRLIDECRHIIIAHEAEIASALAQENPRVTDHSIMKREMAGLEENFSQLRQDFQNLLVQHPII